MVVLAALEDSGAVYWFVVSLFGGFTFFVTFTLVALRQVFEFLDGVGWLISDQRTAFGIALLLRLCLKSWLKQTDSQSITSAS